MVSQEPTQPSEETFWFLGAEMDGTGSAEIP